MFRIDILAVSRMKKGPWADLCAEYAGRIRWPLRVFEVESRATDPVRMQEEEENLLLEKMDPESLIVVLDERGDGLRSLDFARTLEKFRDTGVEKVTFVIGGASGFTDQVRGRANILLGFGQQTWPHMMVRVMVLEQIYRAEQILAGHPYHREG